MKFTFLRRVLLVLLSVLSCSAAFAQTPRIDSVLTDEVKHHLILYGNFPNSPDAQVRVHGFVLPLIYFSDTLLHAVIPDSGNGSCGPVLVTIHGMGSNQRLLSYFHYYVHFSHQHLGSLGYGEEAESMDNIHIRMDYDAVKNSSVRLYTPTPISNCYDYARGSDAINNRGSPHPDTQAVYGGPFYDSSGKFKQKIGFSPINKYFTYEIAFYAFGMTRVYANDTLDNNFQCKSGKYESSFGSACSGGEGVCLTWGQIATTDFPPSSAGVQLSLRDTFFKIKFASAQKLIITSSENVNASIELYDLLGNQQFTINRMLYIGENEVLINSSNISSQVYLCRLQTGVHVETKKMLLSK